MAAPHSPAGQGLDIAVIGSGISGLSCAWLLGSRHRVTVYEKDARIGGHSNTELAPGTEGVRPVDTGFIVYNEKTYPNLTALFAHLGVETQPSDMSFGVSLRGGRVEYSGTGISGLFAQKSNLLKPRFWAMLAGVMRFYRDAPGDIAQLDDPSITLGDYLARKGYGSAVRDDHLLPMAAAIWSSPARAVLDYPAGAFIRFCDNHGLLQVRERPVWRTVTGGSRSYVRLLCEAIGPGIRTSTGAVKVLRLPSGKVAVKKVDGSTATHDHVVLATHADQALSLLADACEEEQRLLGAFRYSRNRAVLHADARLMPSRRAVWSSWNYLEDDGDLCVTYWMNRLQNIPGGDLFVTLNPPVEPRRESVVTSTVYEHPIFDARAVHAQREIWSLQGLRNTWFCGAHFGAGFHEDGLQAGLAVAEQLGGVRRPWTVENESGRIYVSAQVSRAEGIAA